MSSDHPNPPPPAAGDAPAPAVARSPETGTLNYATMSKPSLFAQYFWFVLKNVIGWVLILAAFVAGPFVPGPGGIPLFLIGFALITFPGKRRLTAGILHGKPVPPNSRGFRWTVAAVALLLPGAAMWYAIYKGWLPRYET